MIIIYNRVSGEIVGHCSRVFDSGKWREPTLEELFRNQDRSNLASVHFADDARYLAYGPQNWRLQRDASGTVTGIERLPFLLMSSNIADTDGDGIPDLPADGASVAQITAKTSNSADIDVTFRTTRGSLSQRTIHASNGSATVELRAATETVAVVVTATAPGFRPGKFFLEFVPVPAKTAPAESH